MKKFDKNNKSLGTVESYSKKLHCMSVTPECITDCDGASGRNMRDEGAWFRQECAKIGWYSNPNV